MGIDAEKAIKERPQIRCRISGAKEEEIYFTSGGNEADNMANFGAVQGQKTKGEQNHHLKDRTSRCLGKLPEAGRIGLSGRIYLRGRDGVIDLQALESAPGRT
jgi:cysteine sulfinate desulfinase/cysteine desulfurase-like protein